MLFELYLYVDICREVSLWRVRKNCKFQSLFPLLLLLPTNLEMEIQNGCSIEVMQTCLNVFFERSICKFETYDDKLKEPSTHVRRTWRNCLFKSKFFNRICLIRTSLLNYTRPPLRAVNKWCHRLWKEGSRLLWRQYNGSNHKTRCDG